MPMTLRLTDQERAALQRRAELELNGVDATTAANHDVYDLVMGVAARQQSVTAIVEGLCRIVR